MRRVFVFTAIAASFACGGRKRTWFASVSCSCREADGGLAGTAYTAAQACAVDQPECTPSAAKCAELLGDAGCSNAPTASACTFDYGWDYCDPPAPG